MKELIIIQMLNILYRAEHLKVKIEILVKFVILYLLVF